MAKQIVDWHVFDRRLYVGVDRLMQHPVLATLNEDRMGFESWKLLVRERHYMAGRFESILNSAAKLSRAEGLEELADIIEDNLMDEIGAADGPSHAQMRGDFLKSFGWDTSQFSQTILETRTPAAWIYARRVAPVTQGRAFTAAAAIYTAERIIPREFAAWQTALERQFPDLFESEDALLYLRDHVHHDAERHGPELRAALMKGGHEDLREAYVGMDLMLEARTAFYDRILFEFGHWFNSKAFER